MRVREGFTLVELLIVMVIGAIVMMWAMPRIDIAEMRVRSAEQAVSTTLIAAQQRAVLKQHDVRVLFDTAQNIIGIHDDANNDGALNGSETFRTVELGEGVSFTGAGTPGSPEAVTFAEGSEGIPELVFHRGGFGSESGTVHIGTPRSERGEKLSDARRLELERSTGRVTRSYVAGGVWRTHRS